MSKKSKKEAIQEEEILVNEQEVATETPEVNEPVEEVILEEKAPEKAKKKSDGTIGLKVAKIILYALTFPVMILVSLLLCLKMGEGVEKSYSFWPYVPTIIVALFGLIFMIVAIIVCRKKSKRSVMQKTASLLICCVVLTGGFGLIMDIAFPDVIGFATSSTLFVEDVYNDYQEQVEYNKGLTRQFIRLNLMNGNYDGQYEYDTLVEKTGSTYSNEKIQEVYASYVDRPTTEIDATIAGLGERDKELYDWIYANCILMDYDYALKISFSTDDDGNPAVVADERKSLCLSLVKYLSSTYAQLCEEGIKTSGLGAIATKGNEKMSWLYNKNFAAMNQDGYNPYNDDCGLGYATSNRMTIPVVVRIILNDGYTCTQPEYEGTTLTGYSMEVGTVDDGGNFSTEVLDGYLSYLYKPEIAVEYEAASGTYTNGKSQEMFIASDGKPYYVYEDGHVETSIRWCVLDMLGDPMNLAGIDLQGLGGSVGGIVNTLIPYLPNWGGMFDELLNQDLTTVVKAATGGQELYIHLYFDDAGLLQISLIPAGISNGYLGYQWMAWTQMGNLLVTVCGVMSIRNLLYIFGAVSIVLILAIGIINEGIQRKKAKADAEKDASEDEAAPAEDEIAAEDEAAKEEPVAVEA